MITFGMLQAFPVRRVISQTVWSNMGVLGDYILMSSNGSPHVAAINYVRSLGPCPQLGETNTKKNHETAGLGPASMTLS